MVGNDFDQDVARNLRKFRKAVRLSQAGLAEAMTAQGVPTLRQALTKVETATRSLTFEEAIAAARVLAVPVTALATGVTTSTRSTSWNVEDLRVLEARVDELSAQLRAAVQPPLV